MSIEKAPGGAPRMRRSRRRFLLAAGAGAGLAGVPATAASPSPVILRLQGAWSATHLYHEFALDYARKVNDMSGGRMRMEVLPAGAMPPSSLLDAVEKGALDGCHAAPVLWAAKDASFSLFGSGPELGLDATQLLAWMRYGEGQQLHDSLYDNLLYRNIVSRVYGPMPRLPLGWFRQPVVSAAQFRGLRCHAHGMPADMLRELGVTVRNVPDAELVAVVRRGELDGVVSADPTLGPQLAERLPVCMLQSHHQPAPLFEIVLSRKRIEALGAELGAILLHAMDAASADLSWKAALRHAAAFQALNEAKSVRFVQTPPSVLAAQLKAWSAVARRYAGDNPFFSKIFGSQRTWARRLVRWSAATEVPARVAYDHWFTHDPAGAPIGPP